jgi:dienelactone hydrolase
MNKTSCKINQPTGVYLPGGWMQWPEHPELGFQFRRVLTAAPEGGSTISECFQAANRIDPGDLESWYREWQRLGDVSTARATKAQVEGHRQTARANWLRAANYFRSSEFFLQVEDPRRMATFDKIEDCSHHALALMTPAGEIVKVAYEGGAHVDAYFLRAPGAVERTPVVICFGGLDQYKDELLHQMTVHAFARGLSLLLVDLPGQGGTIRRQNIRGRFDTEVPVRCCVDYLLSRKDVDPSRIALYGASLGGYYAPRAASFEHRIAAVVADCVLFTVDLQQYVHDPELLVWRHLKWVFGGQSIAEVVSVVEKFKLEGAIDKIQCPFLIVHGELDFVGTQTAKDAYDYALRHQVKVEIKWFSAEETGASHCQCDNQTLGKEYIFDWLAKTLFITE